MFEGKKMPQGPSPEQIATEKNAMARMRAILDGVKPYEPIKDTGGIDVVNDLAHSAAVTARKNRAVLKNVPNKTIPGLRKFAGARGRDTYHTKRIKDS
jgi:hypothetical protein